MTDEEIKKLIEDSKKNSECICPVCGRCPTCGQKLSEYVPISYYPQPYYPWYTYYPKPYTITY